MTDQEVRDAVADEAEQHGHGNREFIRQLREGEQDDGPLIRSGFAVRDAAMRLYVLAKPSGQVTDE